MFKHSKAFSSFSVNDIEKAKAFYSQTLGLDVADSSMGVIELKIEESNSIIIYPKPDHEPASFTVLNFPVHAIEETVDKLTSLGVKFEQYGGDIRTDAKGICRSEGGPNIA